MKQLRHQGSQAPDAYMAWCVGLTLTLCKCDKCVYYSMYSFWCYGDTNSKSQSPKWGCYLLNGSASWQSAHSRLCSWLDSANKTLTLKTSHAKRIGIPLSLIARRAISRLWDGFTTFCESFGHDLRFEFLLDNIFFKRALSASSLHTSQSMYPCHHNSHATKKSSRNNT